MVNCSAPRPGAEGIANSRWRMLPIGRLLALQQQGMLAAVGGLIGQGVLLGTAILVGLIGDEVLPESEAGAVLDQVSRASAGAALVLGVLCFLALGMVGALEGPLAARALAARAREGTPPTQVPDPGSWQSAVEDSSTAYRSVAILVLIALGLCYLIVLFVAFENLEPVDLAMIGGGALVLALIWAGIPLTKKLLWGRQQGHLPLLREHWTEQHRIVTAGRAIDRGEIPVVRPGERVHRLGSALLGAVAVFAGVGVICLKLSLVIAYPDAESGPGGGAGERAELSPEAERVVDLSMLGMALCAVLAVLCYLAVVACTGIVLRQQHRSLRAALADPSAEPPAAWTHPVATGVPTTFGVLHVLAGSTVGLGLALWFVDQVADLPDWEIYAEAGPQLRAAAPMGPWIALGALVVMGLGIVGGAVLESRERVLRDALIQRWPLRAPEPEKPTWTPED